MPFDKSYQDDLAAVRSYTLNQKRVGAYAQNLSPAQAANTAALARSQPQTNAKVVGALGLEGTTPDSQLAQSVAVKSVNKKQGIGGRIGGLVTAPMRLALSAGTAIVKPGMEALKPTLRGAFAAVESPFQLVGGTLRDVATGIPGQLGEITAGALTGAGVGAAAGGVFGGLPAIPAAIGGAVIGGIAGAFSDEVTGTPQNPFMQTSAGQIMKQRWQGDVDMGSGYFVSGKVHEDLVKRQKQAATIDGHALTGGRLIASSIAEPDSFNYNLLSGVIDMAMITKFDPALAIGKSVKFARLRKADILVNETHADPILQMMRKAGIMKAGAPIADTAKFAEFVSTPEIQQWATKTAGMDSAVAIRAASNGKISPEVAVRLRDAKTPQAVLGELESAVMGRSISEKKALESSSGIMSTIHSYKANSRLFAMMPRGSLDVIDMSPQNGKLGKAVDDFGEWMKNAGLSEEQRTARLEKAMESKNTKDFAAVVESTVINDYDNRLATLGWDTSTRNKALGSYAKTKQDLLDQLHGELADDAKQLAFMVDGELVPAAKGVTLTEALHHTIELPEVREVRRLTTESDKFRKLYNSTSWRNSVSAMDSFTFGLWRPLTLLRPAWTMRMIGEEAIRMHVQGLRSDLFHPFSLIAKAVTGNGKIVDAIGANGDLLAGAVEHSKAMSSVQTLRPGQGAFSKFRDVFKPTDDGFGIAHAENLLGLHQDELARHIATNGVQDSAEFFRSTAGQQLREETARVLNKPQILTPSGADQYVYELYDRIKNVTADNPRLMHAIAHGVIPEGEMVAGVVKTTFPEVSQRLTHELESVRTEGGIVTQAHTPRPTSKVVPVQPLKLSPGQGRIASSLKEHGATAATLSKLPEKGWATVAELLEEPVPVAGARKKIIDQLRWEESQAGTTAEIGSAAWRALPGKPAHEQSLFGEPGRAMGGPTVATTSKPMFNVNPDMPGIPLYRNDGQGILHPDAVRKLGEMGMDPKVKSPLELLGAKEADPKHFQRTQRAMDTMFSYLMSKPTNYLSRSPAFNQFYWRKMVDVLPGMEAEAKAVVMANAEGAVIGKDVREALGRANARPGTGSLLLDEGDEIAKAHALDEVKTVFDDLTNRGAFSDAMRHVAPFGRAWREALGQWAKIFVEDPSVIRQGQVAIDGAKGSGFFYKDDNDKWVFNYPGSDIVSKVVTGIPTPMQAQAGGLSMLASSMLPGTGPMISMAASKIIPNTPNNDDLRDLLAPYGDPTNKGTLEGVLPPWFHKVRQALDDPEMDRLQGNTTSEVMRYLVSTGDYDTSTPEGQQKLVEDAGWRAKKLTLLRAAAQFVSPSAPRPVPMAQDKDGRTVVAQLLIKDLHDMQENKDIGYDGATKAFLDKYGNNAFLYLQANTRAVSGQLPTTDKGGDFARTHPGLAKAFPNTYGFFAPPDGEFDYSVYLRAIQSGERESLSPSEQVKLANDKVGSMQYYKVKDAMGPKVSEEQRSLLAQYKAALMVKYPGFGTSKVGLAQRAEAPQMIAELENAVKDERVSGTPVGKALNNYLKLRDAAKAMSVKRGLSENSFQSSNKTKDLREVLREAANYLSQQTPGFNLVFDRVFDGELKNDDVQVA